MLVDPSSIEGERLGGPGIWRNKKLERAAEVVLKELGALTDRAVSTGKQANGKWFSQSNDRFGAFDVIALLPRHRDLYLQLTTDGGVSNRKVKIEAIATWLAPSERDVEIWTPSVYKHGGKYELYMRRRQLRQMKGGVLEYEWAFLPYVIPVPRDLLKKHKLIS